MNVYVNDFNTTVQTYYKDLKKYKPLSREVEIELFQKIRKNNTQAKNQLIESNLKFVFNVAKSYKGMGVPLEDLISEGNIGLTKAIDKFDEKKGVKFISYAVWWIKQSIQEYINKRKKINSQEIYEEENLSPNKECMDEDVEIEKYQITTEYDDTVNELNDSQKRIIKKILSKLPIRGQKIIIDYYGLNNQEEKNLEEIGNDLGITKERVRQIKEQCLKILRTEILLDNDFNEIFL